MFIELEVKTAMIDHGFDENNQEILDHIVENEFTRKIIALDRIRSISRQYILVSSSHGRQMYWEYNCTMDELKQRLQKAGLIIT